MNKLNILLITVLIFSFSLNAQTSTNDYADDSGSKFSIMTYAGIGFANIDSDNAPSYNLNVNTADILLNYRLGRTYGLATGVGFTQLSGNGFNALGNFYHERSLIKIPLLLTADYNLSDKVSITANIGLYGQTITRDEYSFLNSTVNDAFEGWSFGLQSGIGVLYHLNQKIGIGFNFNNQGDFSKFDSNSNQGIADKQRIKSINTVGVSLKFNL